VKLGQIKLAMAGDKKDDEKKAVISEAKDLFQKSVDEKNNFAAGYYNLALSQDGLGEKDEAIETMKKSFSIEPDNVNYSFSLARLYQARGKEDDYKFAEALYQRILEINKDEINTHFSLGTLYEKMEKKNEAVAEYKKVSELIAGDQADLKKQLDKMVENVRNGVKNTPENINPPISAPATEGSEITPVGP
jgi:tetratricopeptide (TPR) repeat protein